MVNGLQVFYALFFLLTIYILKKMYKTNNIIATQNSEGLQVDKVVKTDDFEILSISLGKGMNFPEHISPTNAQLVVLEGDIQLYINGESYHLTTQQLFDFPKEVPHSVSANESSKFLIIR